MLEVKKLKIYFSFMLFSLEYKSMMLHPTVDRFPGNPRCFAILCAPEK
jgi:hypothetical protein